MSAFMSAILAKRTYRGDRPTDVFDPEQTIVSREADGGII
jgi:hypothetical protein